MPHRHSALWAYLNPSQVNINITITSILKADNVLGSQILNKKFLTKLSVCLGPILDLDDIITVEF